MRKPLLWLAVILLCSLQSPADMKVKTRTNMGGQNVESTILVKGARQRSEMNMGMGPSIVTIYQCDQKRMVQLNPQANTCMITSLEEETAGTPAASQTPGRQRLKGGIVTFTSNVSDTGERKQMFGYTARRIKSTMQAESSADACEPARTKIETDGWYADFPGTQLGCAGSGRSQVRGMPQKSECQDQMRFRTTGTAKLGFPLSLKTTILGPDGRPMTFSQEAVEVSSATLDAKLFDVPADCRQVKSYQELMGMGGMPSMAEMMKKARAAAEAQSDGKEDGEESSGDDAMNEEAMQRAMKQAQGAMGASARPAGEAGKLRIGLVRISNLTQATLAVDDLRESLMQDLEQRGAEVELLESTETRQVAEEARRRQVHYVVYTEVTSARESTVRKLGGMLGRATGAGDAKGKADVSVDFRVMPAGAEIPLLQSKAAARDAASIDDGVNQAMTQEVKAVMDAIEKDMRKR